MAANGAAETGIGTALRAGAFLTRLTTAIILMGITLRIGTHLVIPTTGVGAILTRIRTTAIILRIGTLMTTAPYQGSDSIIADPPVILFRRVNHSLKSPICSWVSITLPVASKTRITASCERL